MSPISISKAVKPLTNTTTFQHLASQGRLGTILLWLMIFVNDLALCNDALEQWDKHQDEAHKKRAAGAKMYFVRVMLSHINEGLKIINQINGDPELRNAVGQCDQATQKLFKTVVSLNGTEEAQALQKIRNEIAFHYTRNRLDVALAGLAKRFPGNAHSISFGKPIDCFFEPSDRVIDNAVLKDIFKVPDDADLGAETLKRIHRLQSIGDDLATFSASFIFKHASKPS